MFADVDDNQFDYFNFLPPVHRYFSSESPCPSPPLHSGEVVADPSNPLLAYRGVDLPSPSARSIMSSRVLQRQSAAAHGACSSSVRRPRTQPVQNVLLVSSDSSSTSSSRSNSDSSKSSLDFSSAPEYARCSRCQRNASVDYRTGKNNMIQYGLNLWYCNRCAAMVGLTDG